MKHIRKFNESIEVDIKDLVYTLLADYMRETKSYFNFYKDDKKTKFYIGKASYDYFDSHGNRHHDTEGILFDDWKDDLIQFFNYIKAQYNCNNIIAFHGYKTPTKYISINNLEYLTTHYGKMNRSYREYIPDDFKYFSIEFTI